MVEFNFFKLSQPNFRLNHPQNFFFFFFSYGQSKALHQADVLLVQGVPAHLRRRDLLVLSRHPGHNDSGQPRQ